MAPKLYHIILARVKWSKNTRSGCGALKKGVARSLYCAMICLMETTNNLGPSMGYEPVYTVFKSEVAYKPVTGAGLLTEAIRLANCMGLKSYVVRRSYMVRGREYLTGLVVYSKRG